MNARLIGGILLITGTAIGGGMLALPFATAAMGFLNAALLLVAAWFVMTASALLILEINLWLPEGNNIVAMARATLGKGGALVAWVIYLLLFYSLIAAYVAAGSDFLNNVLQQIGLNFPQSISALLFCGLLGYVVYRGIVWVDYANRGFMFTKLGVYAILTISILVFIKPSYLLGGKLHYFMSGITVALTSFGFANIVPSLRVYFRSDVKKLRKAILIGSFIPLICYLLWDLAIMGVIARDGHAGLIAMLHSGHSTSQLMNQLSVQLHLSMVTLLVHVFTAICLATSFLGVSLSLSDFLSNGLQIKKEGKQHLIILAATFLPPLAIVFIDPRIFIGALNYAGIYCAILLILLPALMVWQGRYQIKFVSKYQVKGGKPLLFFLMLVALGIVCQGLFNSWIHL